MEIAQNDPSECGSTPLAQHLDSFNRDNMKVLKYYSKSNIIFAFTGTL